MQTITYSNKSTLYANGDIPDANKVNASDMNEIKSVVNNNATETQSLVANLGLYSTTEVVTGETWINGKPIYRKIMEITTGAGSNNNISLSNISSNIEIFTKIDGICIQPSGNITSLSYYNASNDYVNVYYSSSDGVIRIRCGSSYGFGTTKVILEYTKTTD